MRKSVLAVVCVIGLAGATGCAHTARGLKQDTEKNASAVKGAAETVDVKSALMAAKDLDTGAIDVDTYADKKLIVIRGSVPTEAQKQRATAIAQDHAKGYRIDNQLAVVPK